MVKVKILKTGEIREVTKNEAHTLIDKGLAKLYLAPKNRMMRPKRRRKGGYKTK